MGIVVIETILIPSEFEELSFRITNDHDDDEEMKRVRAQHRFDSFSPVREDVQAKWFVDGKDYFYALSVALEKAEEVIYIEDWWLTPELYLRRPPSANEEWRIDNVLKRKADEGVKIFIVVYKEVAQALTLDSEHTKDWLQGLNDNNIIVMRHPDHIQIAATQFWAHHEKFVIIDNKLAFMGGLDICLGRWDSHSHYLADYHPTDSKLEIFNGQDYSNARIKDFTNVKHDWNTSNIDRRTLPRMPWHDVSLAMVGEPVIDLARHFCERWNFIKKQKYLTNHSTPFLRPPLGGTTNNIGFGSLDPLKHEHTRHFRARYVTPRDQPDKMGPGNMSAQMLRSSAEWSHSIPTEHSIQNAYIGLIEQANHYVYIENQFFITATDEKNKIVKNRIGEALVKRIIRARDEGKKFRVIVIMPLLPAFPAELSTKDAATVRLIINLQYESICRGGNSIMEKLSAAGIQEPRDYIRFFGLRSYDRINNDPFEAASKEHLEKLNDRIAGNAMLDGDIMKEEKLPGNNDQGIPMELENYVSELLYIHTKLMIVDDIYVICGSANLNDRSQCGDHDSEVAICIQDHDTIESVMDGQPFQAAVYATTLRRQLQREHLGLLPDEPPDQYTRASLPPPESHIHYRDLGKSDHDKAVEDPMSDEFWNLWLGTAKTNTEKFRELFHVVPDDTVETWDEYKKFYPAPGKIQTGHLYQSDLSSASAGQGDKPEAKEEGSTTAGLHPDHEAIGGPRVEGQMLESREHAKAGSARYENVDDVRKELAQIKGHLVEFPLKFLNKEKLMDDSYITELTIELYT